MLGTSPLIAFVGTTNAGRSKAFYEGLLGLTFVADEPSALVFNADGVMLRIFKVKDLIPAAHTVLGWNVTDIGSTIDSLRARNIVFERFPALAQDSGGVWTSPTGEKVAWFKDPEGNVLSLTQF